LKFVAILAAIIGVLFVLPQSRAALANIWYRVEMGGDMNAVLLGLTVAFVCGVVLAAQERA
jgi:hypothetical protein